jgi:hypothetical protein
VLRIGVSLFYGVSSHRTSSSAATTQRGLPWSSINHKPVYCSSMQLLRCADGFDEAVSPEADNYGWNGLIVELFSRLGFLASSIREPIIG